MPGYYFDATYAERATLLDGTQVELRCIRPEDKPLLIEGMARLSLASRYRRFFMAKQELTEADLTFLTEVDGVNHFALGAGVREGDTLHGVGVARFIRILEQPEVAEPAVAIIDDLQSKGLGHLLFMRLIAAALERGVKRFHCEVMTANESIHHLLDEVPSPHTVTRQGSDEIIIIELPQVAPDALDYEGARPLSPLPPIVQSLQDGTRLHNELLNLYGGGPKDGGN